MRTERRLSLLLAAVSVSAAAFGQDFSGQMPVGIDLSGYYNSVFQQDPAFTTAAAEVRTQIKGHMPAEPFKIMSNFYFVGISSGEAYLLTSPQGHILFAAGYADTVDLVQKNIEALGFKMTDIKAILINHNHTDQAGGAAALKQKTGALVMAGFAEIPLMEHPLKRKAAVPHTRP